MGNNYAKYLRILTAGLFLITFISSCKRDTTGPMPIAAKSLATLGFYEVDSSIYKRIYIPITKIGDQTVDYFGIFDTGSSGMTMDANGILPASMITSTGIQVAGDSVTVGGITVTSQQAVISYGNVTGETQEYGNLAYAAITIGGPEGTITTKRIPMFLYYKIVDLTTGKALPQHSNDVFGVGPGVSYANSKIASPLSYFTMGPGATSGFKMAMLNSASFSINGTYVAGQLTIGLVPTDLSTKSGFVMHQLTYGAQGGYSPNIPATITYSGQTVQASVLFDTGNPGISVIANSASPSNAFTLPDNTAVTLTTGSGFSYQYTATTSNNLTEVAKPSFTGDARTIFSLNFFTSNEYLMDYTNHRIGLKSN